MNYFGIDVHSTYHKVIGLTADGKCSHQHYLSTPQQHYLAKLDTCH